MRVCKDCNNEFDDKAPHNKAGYINQCGECADDVQRYIGRRDNADKSGAGLSVFRTRSAITIVSAVCQRETKAGFNANICIGSTTSTFGQKADI